MRKSLTAQRVAMFVDAENIYLYTTKMNGSKPDYRRLMEMADGREMIRALVYNITREGVDQSKFFHVIEDMGFEVKSKAPVPLPDGSSKADWDMQVAVDALSMADKVDTIILVTGDRDYIPLVHALKARGVRVEVVGFPGNTSKDLAQVADAWMPLKNDAFFSRE